MNLFLTQLIENKLKNIHRILFDEENEELADVDEIRLNAIFGHLMNKKDNEEIKNGVRAILNLIESCPFDNL